MAPPLTAAFGGIGVGVYMAVLGLLSVVCVLALKETKDVVLNGVAPASGCAIVMAIGMGTMALMLGQSVTLLPSSSTCATKSGSSVIGT